MEVSNTTLDCVSQLQTLLVLTIKSCDSEDLADVNGDDIQAACSSFSQEPDTHLQELCEGGEGTKETCFTLFLWVLYTFFLFFAHNSNEARQHSDQAGAK